MKTALLIVETNTNDTAEKAALALRNFADKASNLLASAQGISTLNPGAFLLKLENGLTGLSCLISLAEGERLRSRTLFFDQDPSWIITP